MPKSNNTKVDVNAADIVDLLREFDEASVTRKGHEEAYNASLTREGEAFEVLVRSIVLAIDGNETTRSLAEAAAEAGITLSTNNGKAPSHKWFDRHDAIGRFWLKAAPAITLADAVELTAGTANDGYPTVAQVRNAVNAADDATVIDKVAAVFRAKAKEREAAKAAAEGVTPKGEVTDAEMVKRIVTRLRKFRNDGSITRAEALEKIQQALSGQTVKA